MHRSFHLPKQLQSLLVLPTLIGLLFLSGCGKKEVTDLQDKVDPVQSKQTDQNVAQPKSAGGDQKSAQETTTKTGNQTPAEQQPAAANWNALFDGKTLDGWESIEFGGEGDFEVTEEGALTITAGDPLTGFCSTRKDLPKTNYEVSLEARKTEGIDFFCGLTFPVSESHCTLIVGGWAGSTVGLSCIDDKDASSNETSIIWPEKFNMNQWYKIKIRVEPEKIVAWLDDKEIINVVTTGKTISLRGDTTLCRPLGVCSFMTCSEIKDFKFRTFDPVAPEKKTETKETHSGEEK